MTLLDSISKMFAKAPAQKQGTSLLPPAAPVKPPKPGGASYPGFIKNPASNGNQLPKPLFDVTNVDLVKTYRNGATTAENVRNFTRFSPELSASVAANNRVGIPEKYIAIGKNPDGSFNLQATQLALQLLRQMSTMPDYENGFSHVGSLRSTSEALAKQIQQEGAAAMELVLNKARLPSQFQPVPVSTLRFIQEDKGVSPRQLVSGELIDLDIPTFFYVALDPDLYDAYAQSPLESALQPVLAATQFLQIMRRLCERHVFQRYDISIDGEKLLERIPAEISADAEKLQVYYNDVIGQINSSINTLGVEEALVHYDFFDVKFIEGDNGETPNTFETVNTLYASKIATASKTPPSVLGMGSTSLNVASTETLMFMINANGMIRLKLQELYSKALTLAVRLFGLDVTVEFEFDDIELRPRSELEAYWSMKQSRILTLLSFGLMSDEEACLRLTGQLPPPGYKPLMGTLFPVVPAAAPVDNGNNNSTTGTMNTAPAAAKGSTKK